MAALQTLVNSFHGSEGEKTDLHLALVHPQLPHCANEPDLKHSPRHSAATDHLSAAQQMVKTVSVATGAILGFRKRSRCCRSPNDAQLCFHSIFSLDV